MDAHKDIDQDLRRRLNEQAPGSAAELEAIERGAGLFSLLAASFQGKQAWVTALLYGAGGLAFVGLLLCGNLPQNLDTEFLTNIDLTLIVVIEQKEIQKVSLH